ncbi:Sushi, nidogen and EGF-like domain-containing protein 1 [Folsomia candida]|uniref:Sushi, nidogen and EGF-like domain-containing protein 1 n=1 Tax=Folsomia candida TaxID=158441 RepID=A0A226DCG3_FOLCA|nr:Sushi, nidogen and EGF-like domain-containing protein 1 [Folsomia candida]
MTHRLDLVLPFISTINIYNNLDLLYDPTSLHGITQGSTGLPLDGLIPFGTDHGDSPLQHADDAFAQIPLSYDPWIFVETQYDTIFLNTNGGISLLNGTTEFIPQCGPLPLPMITPLWADPDIRLGGDIFYRQATESDTMSKVLPFLQKAFPDDALDLQALQYAFIATTYNVPFCHAQPETDTCPGLGLRNTFQTILVRGQVDAFIIYLYHQIQWTDAPSETFGDGGDPCTGTNGKHPAMAGFDSGDGVSRFVLPGSCTTNAINLAQTTNINIPGAWVFRVLDTVVTPCNVTCIPGLQFRSDPYDCHSYYECANNIPYSMKCPSDLVFNPTKGVNACDFPSRYECEPICTH